MKHKVLWVEDNAFSDLDNMSGPVYNAVKYELITATNATDGLRHLQSKEKPFDAIIVDIRLPPGTDEEFVERFNDMGDNKVEARLGLTLLERVLKHGDANGIPAEHRQAGRFGIFTAESWKELEERLTDFGITKDVYEQKMERNPKTMLLDLIKKVLKKTP